MALMNVTVKMALKMYLNIPTVVLSAMTERNGCRQMPEHALSIVVKPMSSSADPSATGKSVIFHSAAWPRSSLGNCGLLHDRFALFI
jgi:hypothetical protein